MSQMLKYLLLSFCFAVICTAATEAQFINCMPKIVAFRRGQRYCQLNCPPTLPRFFCAPVQNDVRLTVCPHGCCRSGSFCLPMKRTG